MIRPTPEAIAQAKLTPGGWVLVVDEYSGPPESVLTERIRGSWKVDANGDIVGEFVPNPNYRPIEDCN